MFWQTRKKKKTVPETDGETQALRADLASCLAGVGQMKEKVAAQSGELARMRAVLEELAAGQGELQKTARRQTGSFEDLLEEIEEQKEASREAETQRKEAAARETALVNAACFCMEQLHLLEMGLVREGRTEEEARQGGAWRKQFAIFSRERGQVCALAGIQETGVLLEPYDYRIHEGIETEETGNMDWNGKVAKVYQPGFVYRGKVLKKAQVSVYRAPADGGSDAG